MIARLELAEAEIAVGNFPDASMRLHDVLARLDAQGLEVEAARRAGRVGQTFQVLSAARAPNLERNEVPVWSGCCRRVVVQDRTWY